MDDKQIRETKFEFDNGEWEAARWLREIAAQLAELNGHVEFLCMELAHQAEIAGKKKKRRP